MDSNKAQKKLTVVIGVGNPIELKGSFGRGGERKATLVGFDETSVSILSPFSMFVNGKQVPEVINYSAIDSIWKNGSEVPDIRDFYDVPSKSESIDLGGFKANFFTKVLNAIPVKASGSEGDIGSSTQLALLASASGLISPERAVIIEAAIRCKITAEEAIILNAALESEISLGDYIMLEAAIKRSLIGFSI
ncbi:hypothetical protein [Pseudomonas fluorescens]|uniref:Uncharacterized protein n=1 Tax=Pseudomonas fluorescens TaxID=294 RepID=A0A5E7KPG3_PSEFL|nr:hypothetical protein [Pseudomonas fluorescens]VVP02766.1 hypothetical protein PS880_02900 [Pseudomonas fluorescens]